MQRKPRLINNLRESIPTIFCYSTICHITIFFASLHHGSVVQWIEFKIPVLTIAVRIRSESHLHESLEDSSSVFICFSLTLSELNQTKQIKLLVSIRAVQAHYSPVAAVISVVFPKPLISDFGTPSMMAVSHSNPPGSAILYVMQLHAHHSNSKYNK